MNRSRLKHYLLFNRNILIGFTGAFLTGAGTSQAITRFTSPVVNSLISLVVETSVFLAIFGILFYFDNKDEFVDEQGKGRESTRIKWVLIKLASTLSVAEMLFVLVILISLLLPLILLAMIKSSFAFALFILLGKYYDSTDVSLTPLLDSPLVSNSYRFRF